MGQATLFPPLLVQTLEHRMLHLLPFQQYEAHDAQEADSKPQDDNPTWDDLERGQRMEKGHASATDRLSLALAASKIVWDPRCTQTCAIRAASTKPPCKHKELRSGSTEVGSRIWPGWPMIAAIRSTASASGSSTLETSRSAANVAGPPSEMCWVRIETWRMLIARIRLATSMDLTKTKSAMWKLHWSLPGSPRIIEVVLSRVARPRPKLKHETATENARLHMLLADTSSFTKDSTCVRAQRRKFICTNAETSDSPTSQHWE